MVHVPEQVALTPEEVAELDAQRTADAEKARARLTKVREIYYTAIVLLSAIYFRDWLPRALGSVRRVKRLKVARRSVSVGSRQ